MKNTIESFIGTHATYDKFGQKIWGNYKDGKMQMLADLRGWGAIQNLFKPYNEELAGKFQDELGEWIADAINFKLNTEK